MTTIASTLKDIRIGPLLTHSRPAVPHNCNISQETNDLKLAKEDALDNFLQNTSPPAAASSLDDSQISGHLEMKWINHSRKVTVIVDASPGLYTVISAVATVSYSSYHMSNTKLNLYTAFVTIRKLPLWHCYFKWPLG